MTQLNISFKYFFIIYTNTILFFFFQTIKSNDLDERDAIQKKTFTKWVNKHLKKVKIFKIIFFLTKFHVISLLGVFEQTNIQCSNRYSVNAGCSICWRHIGDCMVTFT